MQQGFQAVLAVLGGFVDSIAFLSLNDVNAGFMSGNSTMLGMAAAGHGDQMVPVAAGLVASFVVGVVVGTVLGGRMRRRRPVGVLLLTAVPLAAAAAALVPGGSKVAAVLLMALALGAVNTVFNQPGAPGAGLTYMTGTLVRVGQRLSEALHGGPWAAMVPDALLWAGLVAGAGLGALAFRHMAGSALWLAVAACLTVALAAWSALRGDQPVAG